MIIYFKTNSKNDNGHIQKSDHVRNDNIIINTLGHKEILDYENSKEWDEIKNQKWGHIIMPGWKDNGIIWRFLEDKDQYEYMVDSQRASLTSDMKEMIRSIKINKITQSIKN